VTPNGLGDECLLVSVGAIAPVVLSKPVPQPFDRVEFRRVRRKEQRGDPPRPSQLVRAVPASAIENHYSVFAATKPFRCRIEECLRGLRVHFTVRNGQRPACRGFDCREHPDRLSPVLANDGRPGSLECPHSGQRSLLAEPRLVLEPDANPRAGAGGPHAIHKRGARRLKALAAAGSCRGCLGRGSRHTNP
jgi:hypothetical protein